MSGLVPFNFENHSVRVVMQDGQPWWMLTDVCAALEIKNAPHAATRLDDDEKATIVNSDSGNLNADRTIINESGLYSLIFTSRKASAKRFKKWVTSEVLPTIRKTGSFSMGPTVPPVLPVWASENLSDRIAFIRETRLIFGEADALWAWEQMGMPLPPMWEASLEDIVAGQKNMSYAEAVGDCMDSVQKYRIRDSEPQLPGQRKGASQKEVAQERITITRTVKKQ